MKNNKILPLKFFNRPILEVCPDFLGKIIVRKKGDVITRHIITEIEAYDGTQDLACHARFGKTKRNEPMFGIAGCFYVYLVYGMHWMLNITTGPAGYPAAILVRGVKDISGPGRLTNQLEIDKSFNKKKAQKESNLWFEQSNIKKNKKDIIKTPRIGVDYAGPVWSKKKYRFSLNI